MTKQQAIVSDMDGTMIHIGNRSPYDASLCDETDTPNWPVINTVIALVNSGYDVVFVSAREEKDRAPTERQIRKYLPGHFDFKLFMRSTKDHRQDDIVKKEIYQKWIEPYYDVLFVMDDRQRVVNAWRELGLTCFQVNPGPVIPCEACVPPNSLYPVACAMCNGTGKHPK